MRKRTATDTTAARLIGVEELKAYLSLGRDTAVRFGKEAGAEIRIGRRCLYDKQIIDAALENLTA